jgi:Glycosyl hydrolase family 26
MSSPKGSRPSIAGTNRSPSRAPTSSAAAESSALKESRIRLLFRLSVTTEGDSIWLGSQRYEVVDQDEIYSAVFRKLTEALRAIKRLEREVGTISEDGAKKTGPQDPGPAR